MVTTPASGTRTPLERFLLDPWGVLGDLAGQLAGLAAGWGLQLLLVAGPLWLAGVVAARGWRRWRQQRLASGARLVGILVPPQVEPGAADALWSNLAGLLRQHRRPDPRPHVSFELHWTTAGVTVGLWVPGTIAPHLIERAVEAAWPGARASLHDATPPLPDEVGVAVLAGGLRLAGGPWQPLRTEHWVDPLRALLGAAGELAGGETAVVQILARPAAGRRLRRATRASHAMAGVSSPHARVVGGLLDLLTPGSGRTPKRPVGAGEALRMTEARAALAKLGGPCWEVAVRYGVAGPSRPDRRGRLRARAHALAAAFAVHTGRNRLGRHRLRDPARVLGARPLHRGDLLTTGELASLAHLPADAAVPGLTRAGARPVPPPPGLPTSGKVLGDSELGTPRPVRLTPADACQHVHLLGATGSGKSTLITNLALQDIQAGRGVVVVDPKGDLVTDLLERLPDEAPERLVLLDPDERAAPPTLNPLGRRRPRPGRGPPGRDPAPDLDRPLGPPDRRCAAGKLPDAAAPPRRHPHRHPPPARRHDLPPALPPRPGRPRWAGWLLGLVPAAKPRRPGATGRADHDPPARLPPPGLRPRRRRRPKLQLRHGPRAGRRDLPGPGAEGAAGR